MYCGQRHSVSPVTSRAQNESALILSHVIHTKPARLPQYEANMAKYGEAAQKSVERAMRKRKQGTLRSGSGKKVTSRKQAIAIGLSEAREKGAKVPKPPKKKAARKKAAKTTD